ncbi:CUE domain-containing protein [Rhizobium sp. GN54]|uniref:CUE domain-containing protein n=1 Tax=Rhizobium sp. GN54 TaxID=2898150 RepID=UPI001E4FEADF|nr:CUE domain-containing protein [Rhizobium sp. GN54]MCD2184743.1 CUE domain-containing protein [Rhizobium sp. GN54]
MANQSLSEPETEVSELEAILAYHGGDARAAVETLLADCRHLRRKLALTEGVMSRGMLRGWTPRFERQDA